MAAASCRSHIFGWTGGFFPQGGHPKVKHGLVLKGACFADVSETLAGASLGEAWAVLTNGLLFPVAGSPRRAPAV